MGVALEGRKASAAAFCKATGQTLTLAPEPTNKHDRNAIKIFGEWKGWFRRKREFLGYIPAETAAALAQAGVVKHVRPRLLKTYLGSDGFVEIEFQIIGPKEMYESVFPKKQPPAENLTAEETVARDNVAVERLRSLVEFLAATPKMTSDQIEKLSKKHLREITSRMLETGESHGEASGGPTFLNEPEDQFRNHLNSIDNDLAAQVEIVDDSCRKYFETGEVPAPYYAWRIAIILGKSKKANLEREFLAAWCKHFSDGVGARYEALVKRAIKKGAIISD
ncbi:MAG: hypothetical protein NXH99_13150 [Rhodobacteraceae bacterium]|nr:hypothetical protein [Paracoccaceae bacterium]